MRKKLKLGLVIILGNMLIQKTVLSNNLKLNFFDKFRRPEMCL